MKVNKIIKSIVKEELEITGATLLSVEEAKKYLTVEERIYDNWWWLRSPGYGADRALHIRCDGSIFLDGDYVDTTDVYVRPALQIKNLEFSNIKIGDIFELGGFEFKIISDNLAWMYKQDIGWYVFNKDIKKGNDYKTSNIKNFVDKWFEILMFNNWRKDK